MERPVLVTGASSGIGLATVVHLASLGFRSIGSARNEERARLIEKEAAAARVHVEIVLLDVTDPATFEDLVPTLDLWGLVNNAGSMHAGTIADVPVDMAREEFDSMVFGPIRVTQAALPAMRRRGEGRIVNITSAAAHLSAPLLGWYSAAKHALTAATDALRPEVAAWGIDVIAVEPGALRTPIWDKADAELADRSATSPTPQAYDRARAVVRARRRFMPGPDLVAAVIGEALQSGRPRRVYRVGWDSTVLPTATRLLVRPGARDRFVRAVLRL